MFWSNLLPNKVKLCVVWSLSFSKVVSTCDLSFFPFKLKPLPNISLNDCNNQRLGGVRLTLSSTSLFSTYEDPKNVTLDVISSTWMHTQWFLSSINFYMMGFEIHQINVIWYIESPSLVRYFSRILEKFK